MKKFIRMFPPLLVAFMIAGISGCEWEADSSGDFNTSGGAGLAFNFSGIYVARESGGELISGSTIERLIITQTGNTLEIVDSNGRTYEGRTGSPSTVTPPATGVDPTTGNEINVYPEGAMMASVLVYIWRNGPSDSVHDDVNFVGYIRLQAITDIETRTQQTDINITSPPATIANSTASEFQIDNSNAMMMLEGQWTEGTTISVVDGMSRNFTVFVSQPYFPNANP